MVGELLHAAGADGVRRAKLWLEATTRAEVHWTIPETNALPKLTFKWHTGEEFSFDLGGVLLQGELQNQEFLAECKLYKNAQNQATLYRSYLAKCFRVWQTRPDRGQNFMWITWAPFSANAWDTLCSPDRVMTAAQEHAKHLGLAKGQDITSTASEVAERLWVLVLAEKQEIHLTMTRQHLGVIRRFMVDPGGTD